METERESADVQFADFVLKPDCRELLRSGQKVEIGPKPFEVLVYLVLHRERAISRRELYESVWTLPWLERSSGNTVDVTVGRLRKILRDDREDRRFIETVHGTFRFIAPVSEEHTGMNGNRNSHCSSTPVGCDPPLVAVQPTPLAGGVMASATKVVPVASLEIQTIATPGGIPANKRANGYEIPQPPVPLSAATVLEQAAPVSAGPSMQAPHATRLRSAIAALALLMLVLASLVYLLPSRVPRGPVAEFRVSGRAVIAFDRQGQELWRYSFSGPLDETMYGQMRWRHAWSGDLMGDGQPGLLLSVEQFGWPGLARSVVYLDHAGKRRWRFVPGRAVRDAGGSTMEPPYGVGPVQVVTAPGRTATRVVVSSYHWLEQADQVAVLNTSGDVVGEYWHPGHLIHSAQANLDGSGSPKVLLGGVNNGDHQATLVILDPWAVHGRTTPTDLRDQRFRLLDMPPAKEWAVVLFPRSCLSRGQPYTRVENLQVRPGRIDVDVVEGTGEGLHPNFIYEFDYQLRLVKVMSGVGNLRRVHDEMQARGELDHAFSTTELDQLKTSVVVRH